MPPVQQEPNYLGRTFDRNQNASYDEVRVGEGTLSLMSIAYTVP